MYTDVFVATTDYHLIEPVYEVLAMTFPGML